MELGSQDQLILDLEWALNPVANVLIREKRDLRQRHRGEAHVWMKAAIAGTCLQTKKCMGGWQPPEARRGLLWAGLVLQRAMRENPSMPLLAADKLGCPLAGRWHGPCVFTFLSSMHVHSFVQISPIYKKQSYCTVVYLNDLILSWSSVEVLFPNKVTSQVLVMRTS